MQIVGCLRAPRGWLAQTASQSKKATCVCTARYASTTEQDRLAIKHKRLHLLKRPQNASETASTINLPYRRDVKGKGKEVQDTYNTSTSFDKLLADDGSISLAKVEAYISVYSESDADNLLKLLIWVLRQEMPPLNDILHRKRRYRVNLYRRAEVDQRQRRNKMESWKDEIALSTDILCADILIKEIKGRCHTREHVALLRAISRNAFRGKAYRTLQAVGRIVASKDWGTIFEASKETQIALLDMQDNYIVSQAQRGQWETLWTQRDEIINVAKEQVKYDILRNGTNSNLQLDIILLKAFLSTHLLDAEAEVSQAEETLSSESHSRLFSEAIEALYQQIQDVYGQVSNKWLGSLILGVTSKIDTNTSCQQEAAFGKKVYKQHLSTYEVILRYFTDHCQRVHERRPEKVILDPMVALEFKLMQLCRTWQGTERESEEEELPSNKHLAHIKQLSKWLNIPEDKEITEVKDLAETKKQKSLINDAFFDQLEVKARSVHIEVRLASMTQEWRQSISKINELLDEMKPDEEYHEHIKMKAAHSMEKQAMCARATMNTRRLIRGAMINILSQLTRSDPSLNVQELIEATLALLSLIDKSIRQGMWDPWALKNADIRRKLKLLNVKAMLIDPPRQLSTFLTRLMGSICPIQAIDKNRVTLGFQLLQEGITCSLYWSIMSSLVETIKTAEERARYLVKKDLSRNSDTYPTEKPFARIVTAEAATPARGIWSAFVAIEDQDRDKIIMTRLRLLLNDLYLPLKLPFSAWKASRLALNQVCSPSSTGDGRSIGDQAWNLFNNSEKKALGRLHIPNEEVNMEEIDPARLKLIAKNKKWRETQWKKKRYP